MSFKFTGAMFGNIVANTVGIRRAAVTSRPDSKLEIDGTTFISVY
jgi:hypothetical protein